MKKKKKLRKKKQLKKVKVKKKSKNKNPMKKKKMKKKIKFKYQILQVFFYNIIYKIYIIGDDDLEFNVNRNETIFKIDK